MSDIQFSIAPETILSVGNVSIPNAMLGLWLSMALIILGALFLRRNIGVIPSRAQVLFETLMDFTMENMVNGMGNEKRARKFFSLYLTIFVILLVGNQFSLIPLVESVQSEGFSIFRTPTTHLSFTLAITLLTWIIANGFAIVQSPLRYIGNFLRFEGFFKMKSFGDFLMAILQFALGLLDIVGELAKVVSLSLRLFGNVLAGQVMFVAITTVFTWILVPIPFVALSVLSGFIQAFIFVMLSSVYIGQSMSATASEEAA